MVKSNCKLCGKETEYKYPSQAKDYCSYKCSNISKWDKRPRAKIETLICEYCGEKFELTASSKKSREKANGEIKYCSTKCKGLAMRKGKIVKCKNCGKEFETTRAKFCCKRCANDYLKETGFHKKDGGWLENGYRILYLEGNKSIREHIKVMQDHIGRELNANEVVHHINGDKLDNRIENLKLMTFGEHASFHRTLEFKNGKKFGKHIKKA